MIKQVKELHLLVGLPGSGKSTFADTYTDKDGRARYNSKIKVGTIIDFDKIYKKAGFDEKLRIRKDVVEKMKLPAIVNPYVIVDGLFLDQDEYEWVLSLFLKSEQYSKIQFEKIVVDYWIPNKDACIWNDRGRRDVSAAFTIGIAEMDKPDVKKIEEKFGIPTKLKTHIVERKPAYLIMAGENGIRDIHDNKYFYSQSWSLGGMGHSWTGESYPISGSEPCDFDEFDNFLEQICPTITFLQYKKIYKNCVEIEEFDDSDYYSRCTSVRHVCDLEKLYNMLTEMELYQIED